MLALLFVAFILSVSAGAWAGWRYGTRTQTPHWAHPHRESHVSREDHVARLNRRWRWRRLIYTAACAVMGGFAFVLLLSATQWLGRR